MEFRKNLSLLIFDFDGTLFHLDIDYDAEQRDLGIAGTGEKIGDALQRLMLAGDPLINKVTEHEVAAAKDKKIEAAIMEALIELSARYHLAIFTRNTRKVVEMTVDSNALPSLFIIGREDTKHLKPHPEGIDRILEHFGATAEQAALVGDTYHDIESAHARGLTSIIVHNNKLAYPPKDADHYVKSIPALLPLLDIV